MKSKQYRLSIKNNKILLREDVSQTVTAEKFGDLVKNTVGSTFNFLKTTAASLANLFVFSIGSVLTMLASEDVKQRVLNRYENRKKEIFDKYDSILKDLELESGHEAASFLFSPSLYVYDKITKNANNKDIISDNLTELIDDPYQYAMTAIPKIKAAFVGADPTTKKEIDSLYKDYRDINKQSKLYDQIKKLGPANLEKMLNDRSLDREQKVSIKNLIEYLKKNESPKDYKSSSLKIGKNLILEEESQNTEEVLKLINDYKDEVVANLKTIAKEISESDALERKFGIDQKELDKTIKEYLNNNIEVLEYYKEISEFIYSFADYLEQIAISIESKNLSNMISFGKTIDANIKRITSENSEKSVKDEFKEDYNTVVGKISNFINSLQEVANANNKDDTIKVFKLLVSSFNTSGEVEKLKVEISNTKSRLSEGGVIYENYEEFFNNIKSLSEKQVISEAQKEAVDNGKKELKTTTTALDSLLKRLDEVIKYFNNIKVDKDSNETE